MEPRLRAIMEVTKVNRPSMASPLKDLKVGDRIELELESFDSKPRIWCTNLQNNKVSGYYCMSMSNYLTCCEWRQIEK